MTDPATTAKPVIGRDRDGTMFVICADGSCASFDDGHWHPGVLWDGWVICDYSAVTLPADIDRILAEASAALAESLKL